MAKDDYFVIVYKILDYLYHCLKKGFPVEEAHLTSSFFGIEDSYWRYILLHMFEDGLVTHFFVKRSWDGDIIIGNIEGMEITPVGIEFLNENSQMKKAKAFLGKTVETIAEHIVK